MPPIEWVLFDADHTLFDFDRSSKAALNAMLEEAGIVYSDQHFNTYIEINHQCWRAFERGEIDRKTLSTSRFSLFYQQAGIRGLDPAKSNSDYLGKLPQFPFFNAGAPQILQSLKGRYRLGLITNGMQEVQRPRLVSSGIIEEFELIVVSGEIGVAKPDPAFFDYAHTGMNHPDKAQVLVVGDSLHADIFGASQYGYRTCWYNPAGKHHDGIAAPDHTVHHLDEIRALLAS